MYDLEPAVDGFVQLMSTSIVVAISCPRGVSVSGASEAGAKQSWWQRRTNDRCHKRGAGGRSGREERESARTTSIYLRLRERSGREKRERSRTSSSLLR